MISDENNLFDIMQDKNALEHSLSFALYNIWYALIKHESR